MIGTTRDEAAAWIPTALPPSFRAIAQGFPLLAANNLTHIADMAIFNPELRPGWSNLTDAEKKAVMFDAVQKIGTDGFMTCYATGVAYSAAKNRLFKSVYQYEFNRTYIADNTEVNMQNKPSCHKTPSLIDYPGLTRIQTPLRPLRPIPRPRRILQMPRHRQPHPPRHHRLPGLP